MKLKMDTDHAKALTPGEGQMRYFDLTKNWRKVKPHVADKKLERVMRRDFGKYVSGRWGKEFLPSQYPSDFGPWWREGKKGRPPLWWRYVSCGACHWLVNTALRMATLVEPARPWRIITSDKHSTVWDGEEMLFEFNFQAFKESADECFAWATDSESNPRELKPGKERRAGYPEHYSVGSKRYAIQYTAGALCEPSPAADNDNNPPVSMAA
jgi:hypothetical protein